jgi:hypothetical protein
VENPETPGGFAKRWLLQRRREFLESSLKPDPGSSHKRRKTSEETIADKKSADKKAADVVTEGGNRGTDNKTGVNKNQFPLNVLREADHILRTPLSLIEFFEEDNPERGFDATSKCSNIQLFLKSTSEAT